jgi:transcriptional regulator with XRE-family HTH domain
VREAGESVNDTLRRALFEAQLSESDLAARLGVDPKTTRRWLDGRLPYAKYREQLARLLGLSEGEIWPELRAGHPSRSVPAELAAAYPRRNLIPQDAWRTLFAGAKSEINVLAYSAAFLICDPRFLQVLADKGDQGLRVAVALGDPRRLDLARTESEEEGEGALSQSIDAAIDRIRPLGTAGRLELRLHDVVLYNSIYRVDNQILVNQHLYGIAAARTPVYHLHKADQGEMYDFYLSSFDRIWNGATPT